VTTRTPLHWSGTGRVNIHFWKSKRQIFFREHLERINDLERLRNLDFARMQIRDAQGKRNEKNRTDFARRANRLASDRQVSAQQNCQIQVQSGRTLILISAVPHQRRHRSVCANLMVDTGHLPS
jgi:hypothetical protein